MHLRDSKIYATNEKNMNYEKQNPPIKPMPLILPTPRKTQTAFFHRVVTTRRSSPSKRPKLSMTSPIDMRTNSVPEATGTIDQESRRRQDSGKQNSWFCLG